ncbi:hypothetical protein ACIRLA_31590, partial [Streptomyces sp. NPDC102364]|uniref:hypothetical protein n=1 Tax=Streptomyces sp. NPDC102364 TaxID=3366161 RepID=UPI0037FBEF9F
TLLSSQGTDASFVLTLSGFPPGASLRYFVFPTLPDPFSVPFPVRISFQVAVGGPLPFGEVKHYQSFFGPLATPLQACRNAVRKAT